jgi:hypothetical protein
MTGRSADDICEVTHATCGLRGGDQPWTAMALLILEPYTTMASPEQDFSYNYQGALP